jgi:serine protease Do
MYGNQEEQGTPSEEGQSVKIDELGLSVQNLTADMAKALKLGTQKGVIITDVDQNGPAADKGLQAQMVITRVERQDVTNVTQFKSAVQAALKERGSVLLRVFSEGMSRFVLIGPKEK